LQQCQEFEVAQVFFENLLVKLHFVPLENFLKLALNGSPWSANLIRDAMRQTSTQVSGRTMHRWISQLFDGGIVKSVADVKSASGAGCDPRVMAALLKWVVSRRKTLEIVQLVQIRNASVLVFVNLKGRILWQAVRSADRQTVSKAMESLCALRGGTASLVPHGAVRPHLDFAKLPRGFESLSSLLPPDDYQPSAGNDRGILFTPSYLDDLERESIAVIREACAVATNPAMLFSMGKDSMAMLTLARKAFAPGPVPFPLVVIDTQWKFQAMYRFRHYIESQGDLRVIAYINPETVERNVNPFDFGSATHTDIAKTQALRKVLDENGFDFVFGGARRDEEKSRSKERVFSVRGVGHGWNPKKQRPELWDLYNTSLVEGQSMRVFPLSNWTELDVWRYLDRESVDLVPLYFSALRPYVVRNDALIMVDDERMPLESDEQIHIDSVRFRTLGCYPLTGAVLSRASTVEEIIAELESSRISERSSRVIDFDKGASMEQKKKDGYF